MRLPPPFALTLALACVLAPVLAGVATLPAAEANPPGIPEPRPDPKALRLAIEDLVATFGAAYPEGAGYLRRLAGLEKALAADPRSDALDKALRDLQREALLANPLLDFERLLVVRRASRPLKAADHLWTIDRNLPAMGGNGLNIGFPSNHECNSSLPREGWDNEIVEFSPRRPGAPLRTLYRPAGGGYVGEVDLHWDAERLLFTQSDAENWKIWEVRADGTGLRQVTRLPADVDAMDPCYLPDGNIVFGSTASCQSVPCWHGLRRVSNLYLTEAGGTKARQVCFDQDHDFHPVVLDDGQVLYHRWEYTGVNHIYLRQLMAMRPDGTGQRAVYGGSSWFPNSLYFPRPLPGAPGKLVAVLSGYHGVHRMGQLVVVDAAQGWQEGEGLTRISGRGLPLERKVMDNLVDKDWPRFLHPFPLSEKHFLVAALPSPSGNWGIYLADRFDNLVLLREEPGSALLEPVPLLRRPTPPVIPPRVDLTRDDADVYLHDVHSGPGLEGVPRGTVKSLRVVAYEFGYPGLAGPDRVGYGGPWEVMRILGTVPVEADGSAFFRVPARTPLTVQALDADGQAVQLMRSWFAAQPGERVSCTGCHSRPADTAPPSTGLAARQGPRELTPWHGPARGFDFTREVQPVLDRNCAGCHDGRRARPDLRREELTGDYQGRPLSELAQKRLDPETRAETGGRQRYAPAYDGLIAYVRRVGIEDDVSMLVPGEYHASTSPLIQMLRKGHGGVRLDAAEMDRLATWIDLNAPCHGTWGEVQPIPDGAHERRQELRRLLGGTKEDSEFIPAVAKPRGADGTPALPSEAKAEAGIPDVPGWPFDAAEAKRRQAALGASERSVDLGDGVALRLTRIPGGEFVMGDPAGEADERAVARVEIPRPFWMGTFEVSNEQFRRFDPGHTPRYYGKRHDRGDDEGLPLDSPRQPVMRVSWEEATAFCRWLSERSGGNFRLPTEAEWEWACRAGTATPLSFGDTAADFGAWANLGDRSFTIGARVSGGLEHLVLEGAALAETRFDDRATVTAPVGGYLPNPWGLHDLHGNAAEWTLTASRPYPYAASDGRNETTAAGRKVVRGGSFFDAPHRCRSAFRLDYPAWQRVFNVGFRVVCEADPRTGESSTASTATEP